MTRVDALAAHLRGEHREKADDECEACSRSAGAETGAKGPKKGSKRAQKASSGKCEHCGAPTGGRFAPGHDAKLKSELAAAAAGSGPAAANAIAELILRDWLRLVKADLDKRTLATGRDIAKRSGYRHVEARNALRQQQT